ncbi:hypothetical protein Ga0100231_023910 [Opitutaceae bacterium TAV4]|nr:hypothetical protein Ga0100231_023910 [Opitutaceae bacterium TAV4]RRK00758.1 hypothetical protein Ga0100230_023485 [Opitutaceae bacterium TAV3]
MITRKTTYYTFEQVQQSGLLSDARIAELRTAIDARIFDVLLPDGRTITTHKVVDLGDEKLGMYALTHSDAEEMMRRAVMNVLLTDAEVEIIDHRCSSEISRKRDAHLFEKAKKITQNEWDGWVYHNDQYHESVEDMLEQLGDEDLESPEYVWATTKQEVIGKLDIDDVVGSAIDARGWEDMSVDDLHGVGELEVALKKFAEANAGVVSHWPDYTKAVLIRKEAHNG